jgi:hypothetical protein
MTDTKDTTMNAKTILYLSLLCLAILLLAVGGWIAKGVKALVDQTREAPLRPRLV